MGCCDVPGLLPFDQALGQMLEAIKPIADQDTVDLEQAHGRVLAEAVISPVHVPPQNNSAMDGYALRAADLSGDHNSLTQIGKSFAGNPYTEVLQPGQCIRIMTGARMPEGADTVVMQEDTTAGGATENGQTVEFKVTPPAGDNVRLRGDDINAGAEVFSAGRCLSAADVSVLAALGIAQVPVVRKIKVAVLSTGDELKSPGESLADGEIFESNRFGVIAMLRRLGAEVIDFGILPDDPDVLATTFTQADQQADVVVSSGGVSVGEADYTKDILDQQGDIGFWKLAIKPGKPFAFGTLNSSYFFGLPGNPVSAMVTFHQLAAPALKKLQGQAASGPKYQQAMSQGHFRKRPGRLDFQRGVIELNDEGQLEARPTGAQGSHILTSLTQANGYVVIEAERGSVAPGEIVNVLPFDSIIG